MGLYERRVFPWLNDRVNRGPVLGARLDALAPARGRVLEIGFGTGANLPHYPAGVSSVVGVEPSAGMRDRAARRLREARFPVELLAGPAEQLPLDDRSMDTAVSTLTLCSVKDPARVLGELRRVLRDDGRLLLLEHGLADDPGVARWQHRLNRVQNAVACGCNLDRPMRDLVEKAGFRFESLRRFYLAGAPRPLGWMTLGAAVKA